jgi:hypothetical protein
LCDLDLVGPLWLGKDCWLQPVVVSHNWFEWQAQAGQPQLEVQLLALAVQLSCGFFPVAATGPHISSQNPACNHIVPIWAQWKQHQPSRYCQLGWCFQGYSSSRHSLNYDSYPLSRVYVVSSVFSDLIQKGAGKELGLGPFLQGLEGWMVFHQQHIDPPHQLSILVWGKLFQLQM